MGQPKEGFCLWGFAGKAKFKGKKAPRGEKSPSRGAAGPPAKPSAESRLSRGGSSPSPSLQFGLGASPEGRALAPAPASPPPFCGPNSPSRGPHAKPSTAPLAPKTLLAPPRSPLRGKPSSRRRATASPVQTASHLDSGLKIASAAGKNSHFGRRRRKIAQFECPKSIYWPKLGPGGAQLATLKISARRPHFGPPFGPRLQASERPWRPKPA